MAMQLAGADQETVTLAALLHDIGKFAQRARAPLSEGYRGFDRTVYGEHGAHALYSAQFVEQELAANLRSCLAPILYHHNPQDTAARIVAVADRFSAAERLSDRAVDDGLFQPLSNTLATVLTDSSGTAPRPGFFGLHRLDPADDASFFPTATAPDVGSQEREYGRLWREFAAAHRLLDQSSFPGYLAGVYSLLQQYTWCIPSAAFRSVPDISLFDHARTAAAIAAAVFAYLEERAALGEVLDPLALGDEACFQLVVGDLSGIQGYLYDIASTGVGGVARRLRARSLYLQLISEVAAQQILREVGLPFLNTLMASGGRFHLLLPNTGRARRAVAGVQRRVDHWLLEQFGGELALNLASVEFCGHEFETTRRQSGFGSVLERAGAELARRKQKRLRDVLQTGRRWDESAFLREGFGGAAACGACGKQPATMADDLCVHCHADWEVGRTLPRAAYLALYDWERPGAVRVLGHSVEVVPHGERVEGDPYLVLGLRDYEPRQAALIPLLARPVCNYVPVWSGRDLESRPLASLEGARPGSLVTFEDLAQRADGKALLGFVKADVDRLGETFVFGLKPGRDTPSRLAQMSRVLDLFFSGWLPNLLRARFPDCYSVYAGGDDLLVVGPWDQALELATALNGDFARLAQNGELHLSAGVFLAKPGYPIARAAEGAGEALEAAKDAGRNRLTILAHTLTWEQWGLMQSIWRELVPEARIVASTFLHRLLTYARMWRSYAEWEKDPEKGSVLGLRFQPLLAYDLSRNLDRRDFPGLHALATDLLSLRTGDARQRAILDNLGLLAQLWILGRGGAGGD